MSDEAKPWAGTLVDPRNPTVPVHPPVAVIRESARMVLLALEQHRSLLLPGLALIGQDDAPVRAIHLPQGLKLSAWDLAVAAELLLPLEDRLAEVQSWVIEHIERTGARERFQLTPQALRAAVLQAPQNNAELMQWGRFVQMLLDPAVIPQGDRPLPFPMIWAGLMEYSAAMSQWRLFGILPADNLLVAAEYWEQAQHTASPPVEYEILNRLKRTLRALQAEFPQGRPG